RPHRPLPFEVNSNVWTSMTFLSSFYQPFIQVQLFDYHARVPPPPRAVIPLKRPRAAVTTTRRGKGVFSVKGGSRSAASGSSSSGSKCKYRATNLPTEHIIKFLYGQIQKKHNFCYENIITLSTDASVN
ncbi:hypothetical protein FD754_001297, partial [Muntiacus muntjak]